MACELQYNRLSGTVACQGACDPVYVKVGDQCSPVTPECRLMTVVKFTGGKFKPQGSPECVCFVQDDRNCKVKVSLDGDKITEAKCDPANCTTYYRDDKCTTKIPVKCEMFIDHVGGNLIRCVCVIPPKPK